MLYIYALSNVCQAASKDNDSLSSELKKSTQELEKLESKLGSGSFDPTDEKSLKSEKDSLESKV
jgi:flagellar biosynthesis chaperone FliJ